MDEMRYSQVIPNPEERRFAERTVKIFSLLLDLTEIRVNFIESDPLGPYHFNETIAGFNNCYGNGIFIQTGMTPRDTVVTTLHECRHCWQIKTGEYRDERIRERDAFIFECEWAPPQEPAQIDHWLNAWETELQFDPSRWQTSNRTRLEKYERRIGELYD